MEAHSLSSTFVIEVDHLFQGGKYAIVHIGCSQSDVSYRRGFECVPEVLYLINTEPSWIGIDPVYVFIFRHTQHLAFCKSEGWRYRSVKQRHKMTSSTFCLTHENIKTP